MTNSDGRAPFRFGAGRPCLDFIRSLRHRGRPAECEELPDGAALQAWITQAGPLTLDITPTAAEASAARQLREAIAELLNAARSPAGPASCPPAARGLVNQAAAVPPPVPWLDGSGDVRHGAADPLHAALSWLARDALDLATSPALTRVRNCANPDCRILFLDSSRPGGRRWCSMQTCGNQAKKHAYTARRAAPARARGD